MALKILSIGTAQPELDVTQAKTARFAEPLCCDRDQHRRLLPKLYQRSQVKRRSSVLLEKGNGSEPVQTFYSPAGDVQDRGPTTHERMVRYSIEAPRLAMRAVGQALAEAQVNLQYISHLITVSCTGFEAPGFDVSLIKQLNLPATVSRTHIGFMGCHGAFNALRVARGYVEMDRDAVVLLCSVELCSLHFHYGWDPQQIVANSLFADGAAALIGVSGERKSDRGHGSMLVTANGSCIFPDSEDAMTWRIGDHGFVMTLSAQVPELICRSLRPWLEHWLDQMGLNITQIRSWAIHPGGPRIVSAVAEALQLSAASLEPSRQVMAECGNMSSPTVLFILDRLRSRGAARPCLAIGFGPGLTAEAVLVR